MGRSSMGDGSCTENAVLWILVLRIILPTPILEWSGTRGRCHLADSLVREEGKRLGNPELQEKGSGGFLHGYYGYYGM